MCRGNSGQQAEPSPGTRGGQIFESLGFSNVETFIASGNVIFETNSKDTGTLERTIEQKLKEALGFEVATFLRTDKELAEIRELQTIQTHTS